MELPGNVIAYFELYRRPSLRPHGGLYVMKFPEGPKILSYGPDGSFIYGQDTDPEDPLADLVHMHSFYVEDPDYEVTDIQFGRGQAGAWG